MKIRKEGSWEDAVQIFLETWKNKKEFSGALVCGSYITGNPSRYSDIDLHIILKKGTKWRERGNKFLNGYLIEYFANPSNFIEHYFKEDFEDYSYASPVQFSTGQIFYDNFEDIKKLKKISKKYLKKKFNKKPFVVQELEKYSLWDIQDNLEDNYSKKSIDFFYVYYNSLNKVYSAYLSYLRYPLSSFDKVVNNLISLKSQKKYLLDEFPDKTFIELFLKCIIRKRKKKMVKDFEILTNYVLDKMGGFDIDGWKIRSEAKS